MASGNPDMSVAMVNRFERFNLRASLKLVSMEGHGRRWAGKVLTEHVEISVSGFRLMFRGLSRLESCLEDGYCCSYFRTIVSSSTLQAYINLGI